MEDNTKLQKEFQKKIKPFQPKVHYIKNGSKAFVVGGIICAIGQGISNFYLRVFDLTETTAVSPTIATLILIAALMTGLGIFDRLGQFAGAGAIVPVTGFANAIASAALEHRSEGLVLGIGANMFRIAGAVIAFGVVSAYLVGLTRLLVQTLIT
ncbi:stage V sporulation protein AC [Alkalihalophilus pseudofirmus]|uniref:stage V sporulation protein AC n=1 Tax=Alkalihalobacterium alkalinitrilicum TaxID=427920 RepID=UPI00094DB914|nr:stage V sporulation protein AC [Alkalihalobacterium alkalinitrilicum]OLO42670.1 stage V sporulation protein AC [Alkalihalophilus pseudofirmus]